MIEQIRTARRDFIQETGMLPVTIHLSREQMHQLKEELYKSPFYQSDPEVIDGKFDGMFVRICETQGFHLSGSKKLFD